MLAQLRSDRGQDLIEYAVLGGMIAIALAVSSLLVLSGGIDAMAAEMSKCIAWESDCAAGLTP